MNELRKLTRSVNHLLVFETAARFESFTLAARELSLTQPAVSRSIRELEAALGLNLFRRRHRAITLTEEGKLLSHAVSAGFARMLETTRQLHRRVRDSHVTVVTSSAFANYWLLPRLSDFNRHRRDIDLRVQISDRYPDLSEEDATLAAWWGDGSWSGCDCVLLASEEVFPVASPAFVRRGKAGAIGIAHRREAHSPGRAVHPGADLEPVVCRDERRVPRTKGGGCGSTTTRRPCMPAMAGEGIVLGWRHVVEG